MVERKRFFNSTVFIIAILFLGFIFRIIGYDWGGHRTTFQPDEYVVVNQIIEMTENHYLLHYNWVYPSKCTSQVIAWLLMNLSKIHSFDWIGYFYIIRIIYVFFSTISIWLSYLLIKRCENPKIALLFSALLAINPILIKHSKQVVGDTPVLMFWLLTALVMCNYIEKKQIKQIVLMSFLAACATLEKWNGGGITILIAICVIYFNISDVKKLFIHGFTSFISWVLSLFLIAPTMFVDWNKILESVLSANPSISGYIIYQHIMLFFSYLGIGSVILFILGIYYVLIDDKKERNNVSFLPYLLAFISLVEDWLLCFQMVERHGLVIYWGCTLVVLMGFCFLFSRDKAWKRTGVVLIAFAISSWTIDAVFIDTVAIRCKNYDTREVALPFLKEIGATVKNSTGESYTPFSPPFADEVMYLSDINTELFLDQEGKPNITVPNIKYMIIGPYAMAKRDGIGYEILHEYGTLVKRFDSDYDADLFNSPLSCGKWYYLELDTIRKTWNAIKQVYSADTIGPWIEIYDVSAFEYSE